MSKLHEETFELLLKNTKVNRAKEKYIFLEKHHTDINSPKFFIYATLITIFLKC